MGAVICALGTTGAFDDISFSSEFLDFLRLAALIFVISFVLGAIVRYVIELLRR